MNNYIIIPLDKELVDKAIHRKILQYRDRQIIRKNEQDILVARYNADVADGTYLK